MEHKWICNKCKLETYEKPMNKNATCKACGKGRFQYWEKCQCGKWFHPDTTKQIYCSVKCANIYKKKGGKKGKHYSQTQRARIAICAVCGKEFRAVKDTQTRKAVYCSKECWSKRNPKKETKCVFCGKVFIEYSGRAKFCNKHCYYEYQKTLKREKSHFWKGGKTSASKLAKTSAEYKEWRMKVFVRDGFKCQVCGKTGNNIEAHHIKEQCNYPELRYDVNNGITLCHECHKKTDNYGNKAKKISGE